MEKIKDSSEISAFLNIIIAKRNIFAKFDVPRK
jgi:hypothetical protein